MDKLSSYALIRYVKKAHLQFSFQHYLSNGYANKFNIGPPNLPAACHSPPDKRLYFCDFMNAQDLPTMDYN